MTYQRSERVAEEIRREISRIMRDDVKDPRVSKLASVMRVDVTRDLSYAKIYISILGDDLEKKLTMEGLKKASGFIRKELGSALKLRHVPEIRFILDSSIEYSVNISKKIEQLKQGEE